MRYKHALLKLFTDMIPMIPNTKCSSELSPSKSIFMLLEVSLHLLNKANALFCVSYRCKLIELHSTFIVASNIQHTSNKSSYFLDPLFLVVVANFPDVRTVILVRVLLGIVGGVVGVFVFLLVLLLLLLAFAGGQCGDGDCGEGIGSGGGEVAIGVDSGLATVLVVVAVMSLSEGYRQC